MNTIVSILIPIFNGLEYTKKCLAKLEKSLSLCTDSYFRIETIVIDDGSKDGSGDWIKHNYPNVHLVTGSGNLWWSGGINMGTQYAIDQLKSNYILWWNNDIYQADDYFLRLSEILKDKPKDKVFGSKIYFAEHPDVVWSFGGEFYPKKGNRHMVGTFHKDGPNYSQPRLVDWLPGMGTIFPVEAIQKTGELNAKEFPQYHGDSDYTYRAKLAGYKIEIRPELKIWNYTENSGNFHQESFWKLWSSLSDIKSTYHLKKDILFYRYYAESPRAYLILFKKYSQYIGGFFKWKISNFFGIKRKYKSSTQREIVSD